MWNHLDTGMRAAFEEAWEAYVTGGVPIGAAICNEKGSIIATGRNQILSGGDGLISHHQLAHAEINTLLKISAVGTPNPHPNIRQYTLYTTMEPCPLCFGAIVMANIRRLVYAARDNWAGATSINIENEYVKSKKTMISGPDEKPEIVQIAMQTCFELENGRSINHSVIPSWRNICEKGVSSGEYLYINKVLQCMKHNKKAFGEVYDYILSVGCE